MVSKEVDARSIIKPFSHAKYIQVRVLFFCLEKKLEKMQFFFQEPSVETVVYINRRDGLVPLSTLSLKVKKKSFWFNFELGFHLDFYQFKSWIW